MAKVTINGVVAEVAEGTSVIAAADRAGVFLPRFCYHPDLRPVGNCRICQVEIEGSPRLVISCMTPVKDGMVVRTDTDRVKKAVQGDLEFLLANHPVDCPICDQAGECYLQDFYMQVGMHDSRVPLGDKVRKRKVLELGPMVVLDSERCVMCSRCIRFSDEVTGTHQMGFFQRGTHMEIGTFRDRPIADEYAGCYADVCPVGALTSRDFRFRSRVWFLQRSDSVCAECSTGCNIRVDHKEGTVHRYIPRRNPEVNRSWMCDQGRMSYQEVNAAGRLKAPMARRSGGLETVAWDDLLAEVAGAIRDAVRTGGPGAVALLATPRATCEELWLFRRLAEAIGTPHLDWRVDPRSLRVDEREDPVLRRADPNPNTRGADLLGLLPRAGGADAAGILASAAAGEIKVLYLLGPEVLLAWPERERIERALAGGAYVVLHDTHARELHRGVDALLPAAAFPEMAGTFVNFAYRIQRLERAFPPPGSARPRIDVLAGLIAALSGDKAPRTAREALRDLAAHVPAFAGLGPEGPGPLGRALEMMPKTGPTAAAGPG